MSTICSFTCDPVSPSLRLFRSQAMAENTLSAWVEVAGTQRYFLKQQYYKEIL